ncbi:MAG: lipid-A-disaccharide synthase [Planctomyces sp.]
MRIFFSAGEPSGDQHSAILVDELRARDPDLHVEGFGGPEMREHGCQLLFELTNLAVMGFLRVLPLISQFRRLVKQAERHFDENKIDAVILVDFPGFNWWIARAAKKRGIPVFWYLPPQLWAWAGWRIRRVRKWVDHVLCAMPFEFNWYRRQGVRASWVGHPFFDQVAKRPLDQTIVEKLKGTPSSRVVALLPGSRNHEIDKNWPVMLQVIHQVSHRVPETRWIVGNYRPEHEQKCRRLQNTLGLSAHLHYLSGHTSEVIEAADCCFMVSGSISLELLARRKAGVVLYRVPKIGHMISWFLMKCRFITLTNLMADDELMPEFISSGDPTPAIQNMSRQLIRWLTDPESLESKVKTLSLLADQTATTGATARAAELIISELMASRKSSVKPSAESETRRVA